MTGGTRGSGVKCAASVYDQMCQACKAAKAELGARVVKLEVRPAARPRLNAA